MKVNNTVLGILGAAAIGATLGILFAPNKGSETRKKIANDSRELTNDLKNNIDNVLNEVSEKFSTLKQESNAMMVKGKEKLKAIKEDSKEVLTKETEKLNNVIKEA